MKLHNPYTKGYIEYPLDFNLHQQTYHIEHETFFCRYFTSWAVTTLDSGDVIYIPCGRNRSRDIYVVTRFYLDKTVKFPKGVYTIPLSNFTRIPKEVI
jgi:hypothetical protein